MSEIVREMTREELVAFIDELRVENKKHIEKLKAEIWGIDPDAPTVDAVPVVRCEDCKCKDKYENFCWSFLREIDPSDYCSCAKRREECTQER